MRGHCLVDVSLSYQHRNVRSTPRPDCCIQNYPLSESSSGRGDLMLLALSIVQLRVLPMALQIGLAVLPVS
jgi:hypothetical protein